MKAARISVAVVGHRIANPRPTGVDRYLRELVAALAPNPDIAMTVSGPPESLRSLPGRRPAWVPDNVSVNLMRGPRGGVVLGWTTIGRPRIDGAVPEVDLVHMTLASVRVPSRRPVVYTVHDLFVRQHPEWYSRRTRVIEQRALRALGDAAAVIAVSSTTANALRTLPWIDPNAITVVPEGVSPRMAATPPPAEIARVCASVGVTAGNFVLFVGQVSERKNLRVVVEALARARSRYVLVVAGAPGNATDAMRELAAERGVADRMRWYGFASDDDLRSLLHGARALVHPCALEGFGLTPIEAMAAGLPAIVADGGAVVEAVGDAAVRCAPDDGDAWAQAIDALDSDEVVADLAARGRDRARLFSWTDTATKTLAVYRRVVENAGRTIHA